MSGSKRASTTIEEERLNQQKCTLFLSLSFAHFEHNTQEMDFTAAAAVANSERSITLYLGRAESTVCRIYKFFHYVWANNGTYTLAELNILNFDVSLIGIGEQKLLIRLFSVI